jgi:hypothetical protein
MTTARDLITRTHRLIGAIGKGETLDSSDAADGLAALNEMLSLWSAEGAVIYEEKRDNHTLVAGTASYTIGSGATINTARPIRILDAFIRQSDRDYSVKIIDSHQYAAIPLKSQQEPLPQYLYYDANYNSSGYGTIILAGTPSTGNVLHINSIKPLSSIASLSTDLVLPPGYELAMRFNLGQLLAPEFGIELPAHIIKIAADSKLIIENAARMNENYEMSVDPALTYNIQTFDIYSG